MKNTCNSHSLKYHAITVGNFDGMHKGHQHLFNQLKSVATQLNLVPSILTFEPHPRHFFGQSFLRLNHLRDKKHLADAWELNFWFLHFQKSMAQMTPRHFIDFLIQKGMQALVVGKDFRFGKNQKGDVEYLTQAAKTKPFRLLIADNFQTNGQRVSSSLVRQALQNNELDQANQLLGYRYFLSGRIVCGHQRGRKIGIPTLNLGIPNSTLAIGGVYAVCIYIEGYPPYHGVCNIGQAPTFDRLTSKVEVHVYGQKLPYLYAKLMRIEFFKYLREEKKFTDFNNLKKQIQIDIQQAKSYFAN